VNPKSKTLQKFKENLIKRRNSSYLPSEDENEQRPHILPFGKSTTNGGGGGLSFLDELKVCFSDLINYFDRIFSSFWSVEEWER